MRGSTVTPCPIGFLCELLCDLGDSAVFKRVFSQVSLLRPSAGCLYVELSRESNCRETGGADKATGQGSTLPEPAPIFEVEPRPNELACIPCAEKRRFRASTSLFRPGLAAAPPGYASNLARRLFCTRMASNGQLSLQHQQVRHLS